MGAQEVNQSLKPLESSSRKLAIIFSYESLGDTYKKEEILLLQETHDKYAKKEAERSQIFSIFSNKCTHDA